MRGRLGDGLVCADGAAARRALSLEVGQRYQSAAEFARDLFAQMSDRTALGALMDVLFPVAQRRDLR